MINLPPIKICIHSGKNPISGFDGIPISKAKSLQTLSNSYPQQDFEGIFLPCAKNNPELPKIIRIIYDHKENLYNERYKLLGTRQTPIHEDFRAVIKKHFPDIFFGKKQSTEKCLKNGY